MYGSLGSILGFCLAAVASTTNLLTPREYQTVLDKHRAGLPSFGDRLGYQGIELLVDKTRLRPDGTVDVKRVALTATNDSSVNKNICSCS